jgi:hypothetical protein
VPIRTFNDWNDPPPGFCEIDMVAHGGTSVAGSFIQREIYRTLDPVALLAEMRAAQTELGERIDRRPGKIATQLPSPAPDAAAFAKTLGKSVEAGEQRATYRRPKRRYQKRVRMPSMLDPHVATIEGWLAAAPQLTALAIVCRLSQRHPEPFCKTQPFDRAAAIEGAPQEGRGKAHGPDGTGRGPLARGCGRGCVWWALRPAHSPSRRASLESCKREAIRRRRICPAR